MQVTVFLTVSEENLLPTVMLPFSIWKFAPRQAKERIGFVRSI